MIEEQIHSGKVSLGVAINGPAKYNPAKDSKPHKTTRIIERYFFKTKAKKAGYRLTPDERVAIYRFNLKDPIDKDKVAVKLYRDYPEQGCKT